MSEVRDNTSAYVEVPKWNGETGKWKVFQTLFKAILTLKNVRKIWAETPTSIPKETLDLEPTAGDGEVQKVIKAQNIILRKENALAFSLLLAAVDPETDLGLMAWNTVQMTMEMEGYPGGNFLEAWKILCEENEPTVTFILTAYR